jgi:integration host factor subunit alpha
MNWLEGGLLVTLTKASIIETVSEKNGWSMKQSAEYIELLLEIMKSTLASGEDLLISGFGKFTVKKKRERRGRNPATDEDLILPPRKVVTFKCSGRLRDQINTR